MKEYFSHDYNARHDRKIAALVDKYKSSGYGIFWVANEMLHEEGGVIEYDDLTIGAIAKQLNEDKDLVKNVMNDCINIFKLYIEAKGSITSSRVKQNLSKKEAKRSKKAEAGRLGGIRSGLIRKSKQNEAPLQADEANEPKEKKVKESKVNESKEIKKEEVVFKKDMSKFPLAENFNGLPQKTIKASFDLIQATQNIEVSNNQINSCWEVFKTNRLTGSNFYENDDKVYEHFVNWVKDKKFNNGKGTEKVGKSIEFDKA